MVLTWTQRNLAVSSTWKDAVRDFFDNVLGGLTNWQIKGGGAATNFVFDSGDNGGLIERASDAKQFALHYIHDYASMTDKFPSFSTVQMGRFVSTTIASASYNGCFNVAMDGSAGGLWTDRTDFFGPSPMRMLRIPSPTGNFDVGETVTIDAGGDNLTATVVEVIPNATAGADTLVIITSLSGTPTTNWNSKTVTGNTSGASGTTDSLNYSPVYWYEDTVTEFYISSGDFPVVTDVLTGSSSGAVGTVTAVDAATGKITVNTNSHGRFQLGETITWSGPSSSTVVWMPRNFGAIFGTSQGSYLPATDVVIDNTAYLVGEDADRLVLLFPDPSNSRYMVLLFGAWWESILGGGRFDGVFCGVAVTTMFANYDPSAGGFIDHQGMPHAFSSSIVAQDQPTGISLTMNDPSMAPGEVHSYFFPVTTSDPYDIRKAWPVLIRDSANNTQVIVRMPEMYLMPGQSWRSLETPGGWTGFKPSALHLADNVGICIPMVDDTITP